MNQQVIHYELHLGLSLTWYNIWPLNSWCPFQALFISSIESLINNVACQSVICLIKLAYSLESNTDITEDWDVQRPYLQYNLALLCSLNQYKR